MNYKLWSLRESENDLWDSGNVPCPLHAWDNWSWENQLQGWTRCGWILWGKHNEVFLKLLFCIRTCIMFTSGNDQWVGIQMDRRRKQTENPHPCFRRIYLQKIPLKKRRLFQHDSLNFFFFRTLPLMLKITMFWKNLVNRNN